MPHHIVLTALIQLKINFSLRILAIFSPKLLNIALRKMMLQFANFSRNPTMNTRDGDSLNHPFRWYFSSTDTRTYFNPFARALDWIGRKLAFYNDDDYEALTRSSDTARRVKPLLVVKMAVWASGLGAILGGIGALFRWAAESISKDFSIDTYDKSNMVIHNTSWATAPYQAKSLSLLTVNIASFPRFLQFINSKFLKPITKRLPGLLSKIKKIDADVVALQEAFSPDTQAELVSALKDHYPHHITAVGKGFHGLNLTKPLGWVVGSGLMIMSKHRIVEAEFHVYSNTAVGEETFGNKGFLACKIELPGGKFSTIYTTHTQAGGMWPFPKFQTKHFGSTMERRGAELRQINEHMQAWATLPPQGHDRLVHASTHLLGDINTAVNNSNNMNSKRVYTYNGIENEKVKGPLSPGKEELFANIIQKVPSNLCDVRPDFLIEGRNPPDSKTVELYSDVEAWHEQHPDGVTESKEVSQPKLQLLVEENTIENHQKNPDQKPHYDIWKTVDIMKLLNAEKQNAAQLAEGKAIGDEKILFSGTGPKDNELISANIQDDMLYSKKPFTKVPCVSRSGNTRAIDCNVVAAKRGISADQVESHIVSFDNNTDHFGVSTTLRFSV